MTNPTQPRAPKGAPGAGEYRGTPNTADVIPLDELTGIADEPELIRVQLQSSNRPIDWLVRNYERGRVDIDQPYQRGAVWTLEQKQNLIKSSIMGLPFGAIVINDRDYQPDGRPDMAVIDGKQRLLALHGFMNNEFAIPAGWLNEKQRGTAPITEPIQYGGRLVHGIRFENGTTYFRRTFDNGQLSTLETQVATIEEEAEIFLLINGSGTAQTDDTMAQAEQVARH